MTFQAYIANIQAKTGKTPEQFRALAEQKGLLQSSVKVTKITDWLKADFDLGHGHAMAIVKAFKDNGWLGTGAAETQKPKQKERKQ
jgi:Domain of unknown function (DUF4287)